MASTAEYGLGEFTFPRGWFMVADSGELGATPLPLRFFSQDLALYRGESGRVVLLDFGCMRFNPEIWPLIQARCRIVPITPDDRNRATVDPEALHMGRQVDYRVPDPAPAPGPSGRRVQ